MKFIDEATSICNDYRSKLQELKVQTIKLQGKKRVRGITVSDLHAPFTRTDLLEEILKKHSGDDFCVVNGDLFDCNLISTFQKDKEIPLVVEYNAVFNIVKEISKHFETVILVDGNHDVGRYAREMSKINPTLGFLIKKSPLQHIADGYSFSKSGKANGVINLSNVFYAGDIGSESWWTQIGKCLFVHRLKGFKTAPMANAVHANQWFIDRGTDFQAVINGHSHRQGKIINKGNLVIDQGCLCYPMDYESDGRMTMSPTDLGYCIVEMDSLGNVDYENTKPVYLGTYKTS